MRNDGEEMLAWCARDALNRAIYQIAKGAGGPFLDDPQRFPQLGAIDTVKRESATEAINAWDQGSEYTNLLAYLCLAAHTDEDGTRPLFIQFNWDLALDRALYFLHAKRGPMGPDASLLDDEGWLGEHNPPPWYAEPGKGRDYKAWPRIARPHGGLCWVDTEKSELKGNYPNLDKELERCSCIRLREKIGSRNWNREVWINPAPIISTQWLPGEWSDGRHMAIVPPTWRKQSTKHAYQDQWTWIKDGLHTVRRIVFIGYSMPRSDLYFRHFLALALAANDYSPKVYVWNPGIFDEPKLRDNYLELFAPLAKERRVFGIDGYFGNPALFDLERALRAGRPLKL